MASESKVREDISSFSCEINPDIKGFLVNRAIPFERAFKSKTYFLMDEEQFAKGNFVILAYFTVALKVLKIFELGLSNRTIKELDGFSAKMDGEVIYDFPVYLIGQVAKNDTYKSAISGETVIDRAVSVIGYAQGKVGGRVVLVECENVPYLLDFYKKLGFKAIREDTDKYVQLIKLII
ncbi:MAG: hypothetical protein LBD23_01420 [Oscillospiraceae bacterium]|jgi:hypothetical protein|nr:hypothetical protein [Oscillospiraceae bacterium]